jgi:hypothetical protein
LKDLGLKHNVMRAVKHLQKTEPERYHRSDTDTLRKAYYKARKASETGRLGEFVSDTLSEGLPVLQELYSREREAEAAAKWEQLRSGSSRKIADKK